jgi:hypothetical protein
MPPGWRPAASRGWNEPVCPAEAYLWENERQKGEMGGEKGRIEPQRVGGGIGREESDFGEWGVER